MSLSEALTNGSDLCIVLISSLVNSSGAFLRTILSHMRNSFCINSTSPILTRFCLTDAIVLNNVRPRDKKHNEHSSKLVSSKICFNREENYFGKIQFWTILIVDLSQMTLAIFILSFRQIFDFTQFLTKKFQYIIQPLVH